ncbi:sulfotransferase family protein [Pyxidicoccus fallax]|uniref:Sulfotransferase family protein n=1 Tax=Pyxidicoccus fallax TaxID=394095 RepID=A0A848LCF8_9BACT|nr:sulfotransferase family protein [Pyxidicoccus fallax]NMO16166.1 sulfotransferase family protein [Pyxidicoccus fallax]NPC78693.1 sulfotransferase family protein [Pyxidicoccus fallax]
MSGPVSLDGWVPGRIYEAEGGLRVDWCHLGTRRFTDPFFDQTLERRLGHPFALLFRHQTSLETLVERHAARPGLPVRGLVFHMSRCGSTLVAQLLAALPRHIVLSEAGPVDAVLRAHLRVPGVTDEQRIEWLRAVVGALGQRRHPEEEAVFLKLDAWHALELPLLQRAFPGVPWLFLYRDPVEVMASHQNHRGAHMLPGMLEPARLGLEPVAVEGMPLEEFGARVLARICEAGLRGYRERQGPARLVNYTQLQTDAAAIVTDFFGLKLTAEEAGHLRAVAERDAKNPVLTFEDDTETKARRVTTLSRELAERWIRPVHDALEDERLRARP